MPRVFDDPTVANASGRDGSDIGAVELEAPCNQPPVAKCKNVTVSADANCAANASIDDGSFDPDAGRNITLVQDPPGPYPLGVTTVTLTVTDSHHASSSCVAQVTVVDTTPPTITRCAPAQEALADGTCQATVPDFRLAAVASDNCTSAASLEITQTPAPGTSVGLGVTQITLTATDAALYTSAPCTTRLTVRSPTSTTVAAASGQYSDAVTVAAN